MQIIKYITEQEAQEIIAEKTAQGLTLIEIANITEGNFLGFDDKPREAKTTVENRLENIENTLDILLLKQEGIL